LISASTCPAAVLSWVADGADEAEGGAELAGAEAGAVGCPLPAAVGVTVGCGDAERAEDDGDGPVLAWRDGTVTTTGGAATATSAGLPAQEAVAAVPHPVAAADGLAATRADAGGEENTLLVR
jgi:hypothetical protein